MGCLCSHLSEDKTAELSQSAVTTMLPLSPWQQAQRRDPGPCWVVPAVRVWRCERPRTHSPTPGHLWLHGGGHIEP